MAGIAGTGTDAAPIRVTCVALRSRRAEARYATPSIPGRLRLEKACLSLNTCGRANGMGEGGEGEKAGRLHGA